MDLLIPRIRVQSANAMVGQHFLSTTPIMAASMFAHALGREAGQLPSAVAYLHHDAQLLAESGPGFFGQYFPQQRRGAVFIDDTDYSSKNKHALSLQPTASAHLDLSLVLRFDASPDIPAIEARLRHARLAGGQIISHDPIETFDSTTGLKRHLRTGFWLIERSDLVDPDDPLSSVLSALGARPVSGSRSQELTTAAAGAAAPVDAVVDPDDDDAFGFESELEELPVLPDYSGSLSTSWLAPAVLGYAAVTPYARRAGLRADYLHAFAEPLVGLVQFVSVRHAASVGVPWWHHAWLSDEIFVVRQLSRSFHGSINGETQT